MSKAQFAANTTNTRNTQITPKSSNFSLTIRKFGLSFLLILSFMAYAIRARLTGDIGTPSAAVPPNQSNASNQSSSTNQSPASQAAQAPVAQPTTAPVSSRYKDGEYTGPVTDAFYGNVQVKVVIQGGKITDVQWIDYPHDRRTSQEINYQATPWLKSEAIQAQSAQVDLISGATLTSEAFVQSLGSALNQAQG